MPDVLRVQRARFVNVACSLDNRSTIRKHGEFKPIGVELKQKPVVGHFPHQTQMMRQLLKVEFGRAALRHLHGVAAAEARGL